MEIASPAAGDSRRRRFRIAILAASVVAAIVGSTLLVMRASGEKTTTLGVAATLPVPGHPGAVVAGPDALWVALQKPSGDRALVRLDLATQAVAQTVDLGGEVSSLARVGDRLIASVRHVGSERGGQLAVLDWRSGRMLDRHLYEGQFDKIVVLGDEVWALDAQSATLLRLDPATLEPATVPLRLSRGRTPALASGDGYLWVTSADTGEVLRIDPATYAIKRVRVGGFPLGVVVTGGSVWFADQARGQVVRLDPRSLRPVGEPIRVGTKPSWLGVAAGSLFVTDQDDGTVTRIDVRSGKKVGLPIRFARAARNAPAALLAPAGRSVWVSSFASSTLTRINSTGGENVGGRISVRLTGNKHQQGDKVRNGGRVPDTGHFTASGAVTDEGEVVTYRTVKPPSGQPRLITLRHVASGRKGTITFVVKIQANLVPVRSTWTITSGTRAYKGLHGEGTESENGYTVSTLTGTVSR